MKVKQSDGVSRRKVLIDLGATAAVLAVATRTAGAVPQGTGVRSTRVRIGVVGGGFGRSFQWHLHPNSVVTAVCEKRDDRLKVLSETYGTANTYKDYKDFLEHPELDAVAIFTPAPYHVSMAIEALNRGKHVISAVPTGMSVEEIEQLLDTVKRTGLKYMLAETSRYRPQTLTCLDWARQGKFGEIFYTEAEYHHAGPAPFAYGSSFDCQTCAYVESIPPGKTKAEVLAKLVPTWAHGYPPMLYPDHCTGFIVPVTGERLTEVTAHGWGDDQEMLKKNYYNNNPFFHTVGLFKTSGGHIARISIGWHIAAPGIERATFYGDRMSFIMARKECKDDMVIEQKETELWGIYSGKIDMHVHEQPNHSERLPEPLRVALGQGHGGSEAFITHEFISAILEDRHPKTNIWEAIAFTMPGVIAHESALRGGECLKIKDYGTAPA